MKLFKLYILIGVVLISSSCQKFKELNIDPVNPTTLDPNVQLSYVQLSTWGRIGLAEGYTNYASTFSQQLMGNWSMTNYGGQYRKGNDPFGLIWNDLYGIQIKNIVDILYKTDGNPAYKNINAIARIYKVYLFATLTDFFGDVPYFNAGKGFIDGTFKPAFDKQQDIYADFFKELDAADLALSNDNEAVTGDIIYNGSIAKWKNFSGSLRLRYGMRLTKVDEAMAKAQVTKAITAGLITDANDDAIITYLDIHDFSFDEIRRNALAQTFRGRDASPTPYVCSSLWNYLKDNNDPRLLVICRAYYQVTGAQTPFTRTDLTDEIKAIGMDKFEPIKPGFFSWENWPGGYFSAILNKYVDQGTRPQLSNAFIKGDLTGILITSAEVNLLLSEAAVRWNDLGLPQTADIYYENGVRAAMAILGDRYKTEKISDNDISEYLNDHPFANDMQTQLQMINEQLWVHHLTNPPEAYANWRRSGYPVLKPSNEYGAVTLDAQSIPRRICYPLFEKTYNPEGYQEALQRLGGTDDWTKPVWWDK